MRNISFQFLLVLQVGVACNSLIFTAVPPSTNPASKLNRAFLLELQTGLNAEINMIQDGRIRFSATNSSPPFSEWSSILTSSARSIRVVVLERFELRVDASEQMIADQLGLTPEMMVCPIDIYRDFHNELPQNISFRLRCRKYSSCSLENVSTTSLIHSLTKTISSDLGWCPASKKDANFEFHVLLEGSRLTVEVPVLVQPLPATTCELPKPGFKRVESFCIVKAADIQPGDVILDPMCGRGTFLVEAASTLWSDAQYYGVDYSTAQLQDATENAKAADIPIHLQQGDARNLSWIPSGTVDKIISCPPFGRQFGSLSEIPDLYRALIQEWKRVLKNDGIMVLVVDTDNIETMHKAVEDAGCCVSFVRDPFRLGKIQVTIMMIGKQHVPIRQGKFDWEKGEKKDRALWATIRSQSLPSLVPFSSAFLRHSITVR